MRAPPRFAVLTAGLLAVSGPSILAASAADLRRTAARWLETYDRTLGTLVATETYTQRVRSKEPSNLSESSVSRSLVSEFAWVPVLDGQDLIGVRAVRRIDNETVGSDGRLEALLRAPALERDAGVNRLLAESVRHLQVPSAVNFNFPTFALGYLREENADRAKWSVRDGPIPGTAELRFHETKRTLVRTPEGRPIKASGSLVVERATGRVIESRVRLEDARAFHGPPPGVESVAYDAHVKYVEAGRLGVLVPSVMDDRYEWQLRVAEYGNIGRLLVIEGRSTYTDYRRYQTDARIVP